MDGDFCVGFATLSWQQRALSVYENGHVISKSLQRLEEVAATLSPSVYGDLCPRFAAFEKILFCFLLL